MIEYKHRKIEDLLYKSLSQYPVVSVTGARQCGKSTLLKHSLKNFGGNGYEYVSLEEPEIRDFAAMDPKGFFGKYSGRLIIDEAQYVPSLFSYIQTIVDEENEMGRFVLSGSQNFLLMERISQSLAGRCAVLHLFPFSVSELYGERAVDANLDDLLFSGGYPAVYDRRIEPSFYYSNYKESYINRDVLLLKNISAKHEFEKFLKVLALQTGTLLNIANLARDVGVSVPTARSWLSVLESSFLIFFLPPFYKNFEKRVVKSPKVYFSDTGLALYLMGIYDKADFLKSGKYGAVFENFIVSEMRKKNMSSGVGANLSFFRDTNGVEIDLIVEEAAKVELIEIKSSQTFNMAFLDNIRRLRPLFEREYDEVTPCVTYRGDSMRFGSAEIRNWREI